MQPDETDWNIVNILTEAYVPNNTIARALGISEGTVRARIKRLKDAGILEVRGLINPDTLENKQLVLIGVTVAESHLLEQKAEEIASLKNVLSVSIASGRYDLLVEVLLDSNKGLVEFLTQSLPRVSGVLSTESFIMLKSFRKFV